MDKLYLIKNNVNAGPYSESEVMTRIKDGRYAPTDLVWFDGCIGPVPLIDFLCGPEAPPATAKEPTAKQPTHTIPSHKSEVFSAHDLRLIAENYRTLLAVVIIWPIVALIPMPDTIFRVVDLVFSGFWFRSIWRLAKGLHKRPLVWVIGSLVPLANIYAAIRILYIAAKTLKANEIPMSWYGPDQPTMGQLIEADQAAAQV
jgi:hypothetical protein